MSRNRVSRLGLITALCALSSSAIADTDPITLRVNLAEQGKQISPDLMGVFFEDLNHAGDGGLYAELIQNRSFEFRATEQPTWNNLTFWTVTPLGASKGSMQVEQAWPVHPNNPNYAVLEVMEPAAEGVKMANLGFQGGISLRAGERYDLAFFSRQLYFGKRWGPRTEGTLPLIVRAERQIAIVSSTLPPHSTASVVRSLSSTSARQRR